MWNERRADSSIKCITEDKHGFSKHFIYSLYRSLIFTQCSWQHNCSPRGGNLTVSHIFIVPLQMETLYYELFHYRNVTSLSFQMNLNAPTRWDKNKKKGRKWSSFDLMVEVVYLNALCRLYSKSSWGSDHLCKIDFPLYFILLIRFSFLCASHGLVPILIVLWATKINMQYLTEHCPSQERPL